MNAESKKDEETIYHAAAARPAGERATYLRETCKGDQVLLARVETLLESRKEAGDFLQTPVFDISATLEQSHVAEEPGTVIGRYKLLERIGEGGMAVVYMAEQEKPIRRKVALKIIKPGMDTKSVIARFEAERQALAMMDHPNIAKVLDAGATETGRPYFVMELVTGVSITEYCDKNKLSTGRRLDLFVQVCSAVHHAHQKSIIHRDIKPTNVMVTLHDGKPVPKVIDFGIAKAVNQRLTEKTLFTRYGHMVGTPAYMSPEQAEMSGLDIDTRTDVYSLGVLLYELLTGTTPFDAEELREAGYVEMQRIIHEQEPAKPSTKLSTLGEMLAQIAESRNTNPDLLSRLIRGDLDWIVMKSLEKDRARRYDTASALGADVQRHIDNEPVQARAPKAIYRLQKLVLRHRSQITVTLVIGALVGAIAVTFSMLYQNRVQRRKNRQFEDTRMLSQAHGFFSNGDALAALQRIEPILRSRHVGPEAKLLYASILVEGQQPGEAMSQLGDLLHESPEVAGAAGSLLSWILWEGEPGESEELKRFDEYRQKAQQMLEDLLEEDPEIAGYASLLLARMLSEDELMDAEKLRRIDLLRQRAKELLPGTVEAYFLQANMALAIEDKLRWLHKALDIDPGHYDSCKLRALIHYASRRYSDMQLDVEVMIALKEKDPLGYSLRAIALRELGDYEGAIKDYDKAIMYTPEGDLQRAKLHDQRCEIYLRMGDYEPVIADAKEGLTLFPNETILHIRVFCALTALGRYEQARSLYRQIAGSDADDKNRFRDLSMKYVFDTLKAGRSWHPTDSDPHGIPFLAMLEAEEIYRSLGSKAAPLITDGFAADWYRDGTKLAFSLGVPGHSGVGTFDPASQETKLLIAPGTNPKWSPDGQYIAFIRDRQILPLTELTSTDRRSQSSPYRKQELWIMKADGTEPRRLAYGRWPSWSQDSKHVYNQSSADQMLYSISIEDMDAEPLPIMPLPHSHCSVSPDEKYCAYAGRGTLKIVDLALKSLVFDWTVPLQLWGGNWAPNGHEFSIGGYLNPEDRTGLWIYDLDTKEAAKILCGQITNAAWDPNGVKLAFSLGPPFYEIWVAGLDPNISTIEALGLGRTIEEHYQDMVDHYTDVIKSDLENADGCLRRSQYRYYLHDEEGVHADMDSYRSILNPPKATDGYQLRLEVGGDLEGHASFILGTPINLGPVVNSSFMEAEPSISADGLQLFFNGDRPGGSGNWDLWVTTRATTEDEWGTPDNLGSIVNSPAHDIGGISPDGLELYIASRRLSGSGSYDIWATKRAKTEDDWDAPVNLRAPINTSFADAASISANGLMLCIVSNRPNGHGDNDLWLSTRATKEGAWRAPVNLGATVNTLWNESYPCISDDGLTLFFSDGVGNPRPGGFGDSDIWVTTRKTADAEWSEPVNLGPTVNTSFIDRALSISVDGSTLYFCSNRPGGYGGLDVWQVSITLISRSSRKDGDADSVRRLAESDDGKEVMPQKNP